MPISPSAAPPDSTPAHKSPPPKEQRQARQHAEQQNLCPLNDQVFVQDVFHRVKARERQARSASASAFCIAPVIPSSGFDVLTIQLGWNQTCAILTTTS